MVQVLAEAGPALLAHRKQLLQYIFSCGQLFHFPLEVSAQSRARPPWCSVISATFVKAGS